MEALKNPRLIQAARQEAQTLVARNPSLTKHVALLERTHWGARTLHAE